MGKIIGIDLGTTNSAFAYMLGDKGEIIPNAEGDRTTPSVIYIKGDQLLVGKLAKRKAVLEPKNVVYEVKRFIGRKFSEVKEEVKHTPYDIKEGTDGGVLISIDNKEYKPEQLSAFILKKIKEDAEKYIGDKIDKAVITVPAYFNDSQRNATKAAGEIAGLQVERIINEPTAAALSYGLGKAKDEKVAVFDLGGGTFDITILDIGSEGTFQVLSTSGDTHLGGADFDKRLVELFMKNFKDREGIDLAGNAMALQRLKDEAENAKIQLSQSENVEINIPFIMTGPDGQAKHIQEILTRAQFENLTSDLLERTKKPVLDALKDAKLSPNDINEVILVGGSTRIPAVKNIVKQIFGKEPKLTVNPDEAVGIGAAIQGGIIQGDVTDILLLDVTPLSLGVEVEGSIVDVVIPRNTTIPAKKEKVYSTAVDNQPAVTINVLQGERPMARDNKSLGQFNLEGIPPMRRGTAQIEVTFDIDANGILHVSAKEKSTGKSQNVKIQGATNISDEEIKRAQDDAERFAEEDKRQKELIEAKNKLESMAYQVETFIKENGEKISTEEKTAIESLVADANSLKQDPNTTKEQADTKYAEIEKAMNELYQKMGAQAQQGPAEDMNQGQAPQEDNGPEIVDADEIK
ncbi:MAG: molecular chaperone DnaK [Candidatus Absconditabacteria bacterium]